MDQRQVIKNIFGVNRALIGVIHVGGLPGTPSHDRSLTRVVEEAVAEARMYSSAGFHGLLIENTHDRPYLKGAVGPEIVASLTVIGHEIRRAVPSAPLGVQVLAGANQAALAVALACGASFVRVEGFVFAHVADEGIIESSAAALLRYRRTIGAEGIRIFADIKKKHSAHAMTADVGLVETAKAAEFFLVDGVIVTGISTGEPTDAAEVRAVATAINAPVLVGSGVTSANLGDYESADALIVGSDVKRDGLWSNPLDESRTRALARAFQGLRKPIA
jgi:uncharacterized protein